ncbi:FHA domain-containing protein [Nocardia yamanashiensis]|uniref:FHA domain-containing protein n=1 Tax=Nocardia yamanashiensis TaxID=209247 RepID=UPI001471B88A|nr:FHA domain-containing protein [Nocardia yamanashiensis]
MEQLVILHPPELAGKVLRLNSGRQVIGRGARADLRIDDQHVSSAHAVVCGQGGRFTVEDLGSSNGTWIGGRIIRGPSELHDGDVVSFGSIEARFEQSSGPSTIRLDQDALRRRSTNRVRYDIGQQSGHQINNVGRDQYNSYIQQRESFLREAAASRTKARFVFWIGLFLTIGGIGGYAFFLLKAIGQAGTDFQNATESTSFPIFGPDTSLGVPAGILCFGVALIGNILFFVGLIMWIVAAARARKVDTDPRHAWNTPRY